MRRLISRAGPTTVLVGVLIGAASVAIGPPDVLAARDFLVGTSQGADAIVAVVSFIVWGVIAAAVAAAVISSVRTVASEQQFTTRRWTRAILFLVSGIIVFGAGLSHHSTAAYSVCCGSLQEAQQRAR